MEFFPKSEKISCIMSHSMLPVLSIGLMHDLQKGNLEKSNSDGSLGPLKG
jgi:hypothetical protein